MGGIHRTRLAASKAHQHFVKEAKRAVHTMGWQVSRDLVSPTLVGAQPLPFPVSPIFEAAFGYQGDLRFLQFGYTVASPQFGYSDGGDDLPSDETPVVLVSQPPSDLLILAGEPISHPLWEVPVRNRKACA